MADQLAELRELLERLEASLRRAEALAAEHPEMVQVIEVPRVVVEIGGRRA